MGAAAFARDMAAEKGCAPGLQQQKALIVAARLESKSVTTINNCNRHCDRCRKLVINQCTACLVRRAPENEGSVHLSPSSQIIGLAWYIAASYLHVICCRHCTCRDRSFLPGRLLWWSEQGPEALKDRAYNILRQLQSVSLPLRRNSGLQETGARCWEVHLCCLRRSLKPLLTFSLIYFGVMHSPARSEAKGFVASWAITGQPIALNAAAKRNMTN